MPNFFQITKFSQTAVDAVYARIIDANDGFNATMAAAAPLYDLEPFMTLKLTTGAQNFFMAYIDPDQLEESTPFTYPMSCLYSLESNQIGTQKFTKHSAQVKVVWDIHISWRSDKLNINFESYANCVESIIGDVINRKENQNWPFPLVYNGGLHIRKGPVKFAGQNTRQQVGAAMLFEYHR
jgi:hypothetical protein